MSDKPVTPGEMAQLLQVTGRTVHRMSVAYSEVFTDVPLLPDPRHPQHRVFPSVAVERLQQAAALKRDRPGLSTVQALTALRDGEELPAPRHRPATVDANALEPVLEEVQKLRIELADLRRFLLAKLGPVRPDTASLPTADPGSTPVSADPSQPTQRPANFKSKHVELLEALEQGQTLQVRPGGRTGETTELLDIHGAMVRMVDPRTVAVMVRDGLLQRDGNTYRAAVTLPDQDTPPVREQPDPIELVTDQEADTQPDAVSEPELPRFRGRAAELFRRLQDGAELADDGGPMLMLLVDGKPLQSFERATAQRLLSVDGLLVQVAPGRWAIPPRLIT